MTIPWGCCVSGPRVCHNGGMQARREGAEWLTFGEAAEYAGVSLLELRETLRGHSAPAQWGWRGGVAVQLVALEDLLVLYPVLQRRKRQPGPTLAERGIQLVHPDSVTTGSGPQTLRQKLTQAGRKSEASARTAASQGAEQRAEPHSSDGAPDPEMARLYREMEATAARNEELLRELSQAGQGLDALLEATAHPVSEGARAASQRQAKQPKRAQPTPLQVQEHELHPASDAVARSAEWNRLMREQRTMESRQKQVQWMSWSAAALLIVLLVFKGQDWLGGSEDITGPDLPAADPIRTAGLERSDAFGGAEPGQETLGSFPTTNFGAPVEAAMGDTPGGLVSFEEAVAAPNLVATQDWLEPAAAAHPDPGNHPMGAGVLEASAPLPATANPSSTALEANGSEALGTEGASSSLEPSEEPAEPFGADGNPEEETHTPTESTEAALADMLPYQSSDAVPCQYAALTTKGQSLRSVLGPCIGPWNESKQLVAGNFRFAGYNLCRHHQTFQKELGGSVERAAQVAKYAEQEGSLPPLVRLRVEHGASQLLQARVGRWIESGFEAGLSKTHHVERLAQEDHWRIRSWVRVQRDPGPTGQANLPQTELRYFQLELQVDADRGRDRLLELLWLSEPPTADQPPGQSR